MTAFSFVDKEIEYNVIIKFDGDARWLSNFWPCKVILDGVVYPSIENAYQAAKFTDPQTRKHIAALDAGDAKKYADEHKAHILPEALTPEARLNVMQQCLAQKFSDANPELKKKLIETGNTALIEGNNWADEFFGLNLETGVGQNHLGRLVMLRREELKQQV